MRSWLAHPESMCQQHRLGEHVEAHMFVGSMIKGISLDGYYYNNLFFGPTILVRRHTLLAQLFVAHTSPLVLPPEAKWYPDVTLTDEMIAASNEALYSRCLGCVRVRERFNAAK